MSAANQKWECRYAISIKYRALKKAVFWGGGKKKQTKNPHQTVEPGRNFLVDPFELCLAAEGKKRKPGRNRCLTLISHLMGSCDI